MRAGALAALLVMLFGVVFGLYIQPDAAMHPHLKPGDLLLFYRAAPQLHGRGGRCLYQGWPAPHRAGSRPGAATRWK